jgi:small subunit ribosomal protein S9
MPETEKPVKGEHAAADKPAKKPVAHKKKAAPKAKKPKVEAEGSEPKSQPTKAVVAKTTGGQNFYAVGKRKLAVTQVIVSTGDGKITVNELPLEGYFGTVDLQSIVMQPLNAIGLNKSLTIRAKIHGGGIHAQAESMRHAISRAIVAFDPESRRTLKKLGFLTRDSRVKERKKPGLKRARRAPQFSKR